MLFRFSSCFQGLSVLGSQVVLYVQSESWQIETGAQIWFQCVICRYVYIHTNSTVILCIRLHLFFKSIFNEFDF